jgi:thiamine biosynthesis lipoprotein ApbE
LLGGSTSTRHIVDRAVAAAMQLPGVVDVLVDPGRDLPHEVDRELWVGVDDPVGRANPPATVMELARGAFAASGSVHRVFEVAGACHRHVLDPRTWRPVVDRTVHHRASPTSPC